MSFPPSLWAQTIALTADELENPQKLCHKLLHTWGILVRSKPGYVRMLAMYSKPEWKSTHYTPPEFI